MSLFRAYMHYHISISNGYRCRLTFLILFWHTHVPTAGVAPIGSKKVPRNTWSSTVCTWKIIIIEIRKERFFSIVDLTKVSTTLLGLSIDYSTDGGSIKWISQGSELKSDKGGSFLLVTTWLVIPCGNMFDKKLVTKISVMSNIQSRANSMDNSRARPYWHTGRWSGVDVASGILF